eukprot:CAMPEP_0185019350 /NCGR_PEP_ID=MMETSP1103-20130426/1952_1 /TAXON_ID=36769 /ORGANISM="Paraphysomonas bandaiensis, Strain Caron Lab Isolate" /LENGTH=1099 /DNA_ID=CAMNT_0027549607 /DNA_START=227 /DNA_END=3526 /DNA_ORIENTATION=-
MYVLLVADNSTSSLESGEVVSSEPSAPPLTVESADAPQRCENLGGPAPPLRPSEDPVYDDELTAEDAQLADNTMDELLRFIAGLRVKKIIKKAEADALEELLFNNSSLVFAAYSVAKSAGDAQYLAEVCKDIAHSMMTSAGQSACAAQEDVLQCCDQLYINSKITENQLLYLRHLVLIRDEDVAQLYDDFQESGQVESLLRSLYRLANVHPRSVMDADGDYEKDDSSEEDYGDFDSESSSESYPDRQRKLSQPTQEQIDPLQSTTQQSRPQDSKRGGKQEASAMVTTLNGVLSLMLRAGDVTPVEAMLLNHMIASDNEYINAAYELFQADGDLSELQDTMMRCAKLEMRRRNDEVDRQQKALQQASDRNEQRKAMLSNNRTQSPSTEEDEQEQEDEQESDSEDEDSPSGSEQLDVLLGAMGIKNSWQGSVPPRFVLAVFAAAQKRLLGIGQARALCDLYQAQYDLVRAAWEVFNVQGDVVDFTDTLRRIVRDLNFKDDGNVDLAVTDGDEGIQSGAAGRQATVMQAVRESEQRTQAARDNKAEALQAVAEAKRELLKHSLEIMVKQGLVTPTAASGLYERALRGDPLTDAAIEGYAGDRNIMEFLDTLQILANNTPEDLDRIMRDAIKLEAEAAAGINGQQDDSESGSDRERVEVLDEQEDDEDGDDGDDGDLDRAQIELRSFITRLVKDGAIDRHVYTVLLKLIISRDDRVMAAHDVYRDFGDEEDLIDSLVRVARKENLKRQESDDKGIEMSSLGSRAPTTSGKAATKSPGMEVEMTTMNKQDGSDEESEEEESGDEGPGLFNSDEQKSILQTLANAGVLTADALDQLCDMADDGDRTLKRIFRQYEQTKDVYLLIENLKRSVEGSDESGSGDSSNGGDDTDDGSDDDEKQALDEDERESIETRFLGIIQGMNLSHLETAALRLAIARDDDSIRSALEAFRASRNEEVLMETLREVARRTISDTLTEAGYDGVEGDEDEVPNGQRQRNDRDDESDENEERDDDEGDENDEDNEDDEPAEEDRGLMSTQSARDYIFPILLSELVKENVMTSEDGAVLKTLFDKGDVVVNAALDVYDLDSDMAELVDTLQRVVTASRGQ